VPGDLSVGDGDEGWSAKGGAVGVPLEVMVATRTIPRVFTGLRLTDRLYLCKIQIRNCVITAKQTLLDLEECLP
jgi:hypothetical protein